MSKPPLFTIGLEVYIRGIEELTEVLREIVCRLPMHRHKHPHLTGGSIVIIVKDDNPDVGYSISGVSATDSEGNAVPEAKLTYEVTSTDDAVVAVTVTDDTSGSVKFGSPGVATVNVQVKAGETLLGSFAQPFTVTAGDPAAISGGSINFDGLSDDGGH